MPITNGIYNNQGQTGNMSTASTRRTFRSGNSTVTLREGETLKGVVSDIHGNEITISMEDGSAFTGQLPEASQYSIGQKAAFLITNMEGSKIYMKAMSAAYVLGMEDTIEQALEEAGLPKTPRNLDVVRSLLQNTQSISRQNIMSSLQLCSKYPDASVDSVITMKRLGMPMTETSVAQFDQYKNQTHQLMTRMNTLTDSVQNLLNDLVNENPSIARYALNETLNIALDSLPSLEEFHLIEQQTMDEMEAAEAQQELALENSEQGAEQQEINETVTATEDGTNDSQKAGILNANNPEASDTSPLSRMKQLFSGFADKAKELATTNNAVAEESPFIPEQTGKLLTQEEREQFSSILEKYFPEETLSDSLKEGDLTARKLLTTLKTVLPSIPDEELGSIIQSKGFEKVLKGQFLSDWTLSPEGLKERGSIERLYQKMEEQINNLTSMSRMFASQPGGESIIRTTTDMQENIDFMKTLNEQFSYMQLPLKLSEQNAHGDLYVMTRKNALKKSSDNLKVLLHLEMDTLGPLDIHITKENTSISTRFYVRKESARKLLERNADLLKDAINQQGYAFTSEFHENEKKIDIVKDFIEQDAPVGGITRYNFDLRA